MLAFYHPPWRGRKQAMTRFSCFVFVLMRLALFYAAPPAMAKDAVDKFSQSEMEKQHIAGLSLLVAQSGKIIRAQGYGLSNVELQVPVKPETVFQSGSVGKQFTATAIMMLVEEGKIRISHLSKPQSASCIRNGLGCCSTRSHTDNLCRSDASYFGWKKPERLVSGAETHSQRSD